MFKLQALTAAVLLAGATGLHAAPAASGLPAPQVASDIVKVHGIHQSCQRGPGGWHRHNQWGERRTCRTWRGQGQRPNACVKVGPIFYCDY